MTKVEDALKSLTGGVSQQAENLRGPGHVQEMYNVVPDLIEGAKTRPGTHFRRLLMGSGWPGSWAAGTTVHFIDKGTEHYVVFAGNGDIRVFDVATGGERVVNKPDGTGYLSGVNLSFLSINDYTFITNRAVVVEEDTGDVAPVPAPQAIVHVKQGDYKVAYSLSVYDVWGNHIATGSHITPDSPVDSIRPSAISVALGTNFASAVHAAQPGQWSVTLADNIFVVRRNDGADFRIRTADNVNDNNLKLIKGTVRNFSDLPNTAPSGHVVEVLGDPTIPEDNFWVRAEILDAGTISKVVWKETTKPGVTLSFRNWTAPHVLIRESNGTFTFRRAQWGKRRVGDAERSPMPSFVGRRIDHLTATQGRLFVCADANVIASRSTDLFHFFRQTATALLDDDPIDVSALYPKEVHVRAAVPWNERVLLIANTAQFLLRGSPNGAITPKTAAAEVVGTWTCFPEGGIAATEDRVFVPFLRSKLPDTVGILQFASPTINTDKPIEGTDLTEHVPGYIPATPRQLLATDITKQLFVRTNEGLTPGGLSGFQWKLGPNGAMTQMAWFKLDLSHRSILGASFSNADMYLVTYTTAGEVWLETLEMTSKIATSAPFVPSLDVWSVVGPGVQGGGVTTFTLPFKIPLPSPALVPFEVYSMENFGVALPIVAATPGTNQVTVAGLIPGGVGVGMHIDDYIILPKFFVRRASQQGGFETLPGDRLQILRIGVGHEQSGPFEISIKAVGQPERIARSRLGYPLTGTFWTGVGGKNTETTIVIRRPALAMSPMRLSFVRWRGNLIQSGRLLGRSRSKKRLGRLRHR